MSTFRTYYGRISWTNESITVSDGLQKLCTTITVDEGCCIEAVVATNTHLGILTFDKLIIVRADALDEIGISVSLSSLPLTSSLIFTPYSFKSPIQISQLHLSSLVYDDEPSKSRSSMKVAPFLICSTLYALYLYSKEQKKLWKISLSEETPSSMTIDGIPENEDFVKMTGGYDHILLLSSSRKLYAVGTGLHGELGTGCLSREHRLIQVAPCEGQPIDIACGAWHSLTLTHSGKLYGWGWNKDGQLGEEAEPCQTLPLQIEIEKLLEEGENEKRLPRETSANFEILAVNAERNSTTIWYTVDGDKEEQQVTIGTGYQI